MQDAGEIRSRRDVVAGVRDVVDPEIAAECLDHPLRVRRPTQGCGHPLEQGARFVGGHPIARVDVLRRYGSGRQVTQMSPEARQTEPHHAARLFASAHEVAPQLADANG